MKFRAEINGLRALAVLPVILFHAGVPGFEGGYLGVDVFFVISGYLITGILVRQAKEGTLSFPAFYENRIRRIMPALVAMTIIVTAFALLFMVPYSLKNYGQSVVATLLSANNVLLFLTSGYWSTAAEFKPLFHTWSLGVEEQYYLLAPLVIYLFAVRRGRHPAALAWALVALCFLSLYCSYASEDKEFNFLMLFTRAWELLLGGLMALPNNSPAPNNWLSAVALVMLVCGYALPSLMPPSQPISNLLPVAASALIIRFAGPSTLCGRLLAVSPLASIGLSSYSIYLWHQPLIAFLRLASETPPHFGALAAFGLLSVPVGYLSWRYIENPFRDKSKINKTILFTFVGVGSMIALAFGLAAYYSYGFQRLWPNLSYGGNPQVYVDAPSRFKGEAFRDSSGRTRLLVIGNSYARDYINMLEAVGSTSSVELVYFESNPCAIRSSLVGRSLVQSADIVVITSNWGFEKDTDQEVQRISDCVDFLIPWTRADKLFVLGTKNFGWNNDFVKVHRLHDSVRIRPVAEIVQFNARARARIPNYVDVMGTIVDSHGEVPLFTPDGRFITYDTNHLTPSGARYLGEVLSRRYPMLFPGVNVKSESAKAVLKK